MAGGDGRQDRRLRFARLLAAGFDGRDAGKIRGEGVVDERFRVEFDQSVERKVHRGELSAGAIDQAGGRGHGAAVFFHDVDCFHETPAAGDNVFDDDEFLSGFDLEAAAQDERAVVVFFGKDMRLAQLAGVTPADTVVVRRNGAA